MTAGGASHEGGSCGVAPWLRRSWSAEPRCVHSPGSDVAASQTTVPGGSRERDETLVDADEGTVGRWAREVGGSDWEAVQIAEVTPGDGHDCRAAGDQHADGCTDGDE